MWLRFAACRTRVDLTFALDGSGSIGKSNFRREVDFTREVIYGLNLDSDSRIALETYSNSANVSTHE